MRKIWNQVAYNLKKDRSSYLSFGIIIMITALILNCAGVLLLQAERAYDEKFDKLNTVLCENAFSAGKFSNMMGPINNNLGYVQYAILAIVGGIIVVLLFPYKLIVKRNGDFEIRTLLLRVYRRSEDYDIPEGGNESFDIEEAGEAEDAIEA